MAHRYNKTQPNKKLIQIIKGVKLMQMRQSENHLSMLGYLKEINLDLKSKVKDGVKINYITGRLSLKINEEREVTVNVSYVPELTKSGTLSKKYAVLKELVEKKHPTVATLDEFKANAKKKAQAIYLNDEVALNQALAEIENMKPAVLSLWGDTNFAPRVIDSTYYSSAEDMIKEGTKIDLGFANVTLKDSSTDPSQFHAKGSLEIYITGIMEEVRNEEPTGRTIVKGLVSGYNGVFPVDIVALKTEEFDFASMCASQLSVGQTVVFFIELAYGRIIQRIERGGFGKALVEEKVKSIFELQTLGGSFVAEETSFTSEQMQMALQQRKGAYFDSLKKRAQESTPAAPAATNGFGGVSGFASSTSMAGARPNPSSLF